MRNPLSKLFHHLQWRRDHWRNERNRRRWQADHFRSLETSFNKHVAIVREATRARPVEAIFLPEHIGDIIAAEPLVRLIKGRPGNPAVAWLVHPQFQELVAANPEVDLVIPINCGEEYNRLAGADLFSQVHCCRIAKAGCWICGTDTFTPAQARPLDNDNYYRGRTLLQAFCANAGLPDCNDSPRLRLPGSAKSRVSALDLPDRFVCVHAVSNDPARNWAQEKWRELAGRIAVEHRLPVVEIGLNPVLEPSAGVRTDLCGKLSLIESAAVVAEASLFIGIDSGPAHFANAAGISRIALLGRFHTFASYLPYSGDLEWLSNLEAIQWATPSADIPVGEVMHRVGSLRARGFPGHNR